MTPRATARRRVASVTTVRHQGAPEPEHARPVRHGLTSPGGGLLHDAQVPQRLLSTLGTIERGIPAGQHSAQAQVVTPADLPMHGNVTTSNSSADGDARSEPGHLMAGDVVVVSSPASAFRAVVVGAVHAKTVINERCVRLRMRDDAVDPAYVAWYLNTEHVRATVTSQVNRVLPGSTQRVQPALLEQLTIPLPSRNRQAAIVSADGKLNNLDDQVAALGTLNRQLRRSIAHKLLNEPARVVSPDSNPEVQTE